MLSSEGNAGERWKTTIGIIGKKATLLVQHTSFLHFFAVVLHDYNVNTCSRSLFFFTAAHYHLALVAAKISHFVTASTKFSCHPSCRKMTPLFFISRSRSLSPFFSLSFAGLPPTFSFSLSFSCSIFQICGHDNLSKLHTLDKTDTETISAFRFRLYSVSLVVSALQDGGGYAISHQNNLELHFGCHTSWLSYFTLVCLWCGRTVARAIVSDHFLTHGASLGRFVRESSAIIWENLIRIKAFCIWLSVNNYFTGEIFRGSCQPPIFINSLNEENHETILIISITLTVTLIAYAYRKWPEWIVNIYLLYHTKRL